MFEKSFKFCLVLVLLCSCFVPVLATDSVYVWSNNSNPEAISTSNVIRW